MRHIQRTKRRATAWCGLGTHIAVVLILLQVVERIKFVAIHRASRDGKLRPAQPRTGVSYHTNSELTQTSPSLESSGACACAHF